MIAAVGIAMAASLVIVIAAGANGVSTTTPSNDDRAPQITSAPPPLEIPRSAQAPLGDETASVEAASAAVASVVAAGNQISIRADGGVAGLESVASGFVWGELQSLAVERQQLGYTQVGEATITRTSVQSIDLDAPLPIVELAVCIDSSSVDVLDANGRSLEGLLYTSEGSVLNIYGANFIDGTWKITTHTIPDNSTCEQ